MIIRGFKVGFWCPEEDVELFIFPFIYSYLFLFKNIKAVPKAVPIYASGQSNDLWLAPRTGHWWFLQRRSASSPFRQMLRGVRMAASALGQHRALWLELSVVS